MYGDVNNLSGLQCENMSTFLTGEKKGLEG
jgi:hypothetical protein